eukprot:g1728.t1
MRKKFTKTGRIAYVHRRRAVRRTKGRRVLLFFAHATGMHKELFLPNLKHIESRLFPAGDVEVVSVDFRGHGDSPKLDLDREGCMRTSWSRVFADDIIEVLDDVRTDEPRIVIGIGHSMGAANLVHAQLSNPRTFDGLVLCEPILPFPGGTRLMPEKTTKRHPFAVRTLRRKNGWKSISEARAYFISKQMFARWDKDCLEEYLRHGLFECADGTFRLKCEPVQEASIYDSTGSCVHDALNTIVCPTALMVGQDSFHMSGPNNMKTVQAFDAIAAKFGNPVAARSVKGTAWVVPESTHFFPQERPSSLVDAVVEVTKRASRASAL